MKIWSCLGQSSLGGIEAIRSKLSAPKAQGWSKTHRVALVGHGRKFTYRADKPLCNENELEIRLFVSQEHGCDQMRNWDSMS
jgi:hypothetical protein